jgi:hypothetical protein
MVAAFVNAKMWSRLFPGPTQFKRQKPVFLIYFLIWLRLVKSFFSLQVQAVLDSFVKSALNELIKKMNRFKRFKWPTPKIITFLRLAPDDFFDIDIVACIENVSDSGCNYRYHFFAKVRFYKRYHHESVCQKFQRRITYKKIYWKNICLSDVLFKTNLVLKLKNPSLLTHSAQIKMTSRVFPHFFMFHVFYLVLLLAALDTL